MISLQPAKNGYLNSLPHLIWLLLLTSPVIGQTKFVANYDENKIPAYELPAILTMQDGTPVSTQQ